MTGRTYDSVSFVWNSYPEATGYQVYRAYSKDGTYKKINTVTKTSIKKSGLTTNKTCYYKVRAYKKSGGKTIYTKFTSAIAGTPTLSTPAVSVVSSKTGISVKWNAISGASGYEVYRSPSKGGSYNKVKSTTGTSFSNESVTVNQEYYYKVRAYRTIDGDKKYGSFSGPQLGVKASISKVSGEAQHQRILMLDSPGQVFPGLQVMKYTERQDPVATTRMSATHLPMRSMITMSQMD
jgi:hypothetical protein